MTCIVLRTPGAVFSLWGKPELGDVDRILAVVEQAAREAGRPVVYVTRVPADAPAPESDVRKYLNRQLPAMIKGCTSYHVILEGDGFVAALKRGVLTSLLQPIWQRKVFYVHADPKKLTGALTPAERAPAARLLAAAAERGYLACAAPADAPQA